MGRPKGSKNKEDEVENTPVENRAIVENVPRETFAKPVEVPAKKTQRPPQDDAYFRDGRWWTRDHLPLCLDCGHQDDRHHAWREVEVAQRVRDLTTGRLMDTTRIDKYKKYDLAKRPRPCQHACRCEEYK